MRVILRLELLRVHQEQALPPEEMLPQKEVPEYLLLRRELQEQRHQGMLLLYKEPVDIQPVRVAEYHLQGIPQERVILLRNIAVNVQVLPFSRELLLILEIIQKESIALPEVHHLLEVLNRLHLLQVGQHQEVPHQILGLLRHLQVVVRRVAVDLHLLGEELLINH